MPTNRQSEYALNHIVVAISRGATPKKRTSGGEPVLFLSPFLRPPSVCRSRPPAHSVHVELAYTCYEARVGPCRLRRR